MKRLSDLEMMDYLDGTLAPDRLAAVEAHLASNAEDAELLADLKMAQGTLHEMSAEPIVARDDFWQKVRMELPQPRKAAPAKSLLAQVGAWLWPAQSPMGMSLRVAVLAAFLAMIATWFGPLQTQYSGVAGPQSVPMTAQQQSELGKRVPPKRDAKPLPGAVNSNEGAEIDN